MMNIYFFTFCLCATIQTCLYSLVVGTTMMSFQFWGMCCMKLNYFSFVGSVH